MTSRRRGFTLVELAIVIVIAGILAAVAIPIYQGIVEKSKWSEAITACSQISSAMRVLKAEGSGQLTAYTAGTGIVSWTELDLNQSEFDGSEFLNADYSFSLLDKPGGLFTVQAQAGDNIPVGTYRLSQDGTAVGP